MHRRIRTSLICTVLLIASIGCEVKPHGPVDHSGDITRSRRTSKQSQWPGASLAQSISAADASKKELLVDQYLQMSDVRDSDKLDIVNKFGSKEQKRRRLLSLNEAVDWRADGIHPMNVVEARPFLDLSQVSAKVKGDIIHGLERHTNAQIEGSDLEFNKMSKKQLFDLCDVDACLFKSEHPLAIEKASKMLEADPQNEILIEIYLVAVSRGHGWKEATSKYGELKSRVHDAERRSRLEREVDAPNRVIFHTAHGDQVNKF